jgi:hypothetical protein
VNECRICGGVLTHHPDCGNRARAELERVRAGIRSNTEGVLQDDPDTRYPELQPWEIRDLRERLEDLL